MIDRYTAEQDRLDLRAGVLASVMASAFGGKRDNGEPFTAVDFFPLLDKKRQRTGKPAKMQSITESITAMQAWTVVLQQHKSSGNLDESKVPDVLPGVSEILPVA